MRSDKAGNKTGAVLSSVVHPRGPTQAAPRDACKLAAP